MQYTLSLSPNYVRHWGLWQAVRELLQNAYDQRDRDPGCLVKAAVDARGTLRVSTSSGELSRRSLLLGESDKKPGERGSFGEGYKLAMLVLCRLGHRVTVYNGAWRWEARLEHDTGYGCQVLRVLEEPLDVPEPGVAFLVEGVGQEAWAGLQGNLTEARGILVAPVEAGRVYVGGLYVGEAAGYRYGYAFAPGQVKLDRDRGTVEGFDLACATSSLWAERGGPELYNLVKTRAPDVRYLHDGDAHIADGFAAEHGDAVPVADEEGARRCQAAGRDWVLVPERVREAVAASGRDLTVVAPGETAAERLDSLLRRRANYFAYEDLLELTAILKMIGGA